MANFCSKCGNKLEENQVFCPKCGAAVAPAASQTPNTNSSAPQYTTDNPSSFNIQEVLKNFWNRFTTNAKHIPETVKTNKMVLVALIVSAVLLISLFLPFAKLSFFGISESYNFMNTGCGFITLLSVLIGAALVATKEWLASLIAGGFTTLFFIIEWIAKDNMLSCGFGFYVMLIAIIAFIVVVLLEFLKTKKIVK